MKHLNLYTTVLFLALMSCMACKKNTPKTAHQHDEHGNHIETSTIAETEEEHGKELTLTNKQLNSLDIKIGTLTKRNMNGFIQVNGYLGVPPQNEAVVTTTLGANINSIQVIEGDKVKKGQVLAYVSHPDFIRLQTDYLQTFNSLQFLEQEYNRQKKLYDANVGSGRDYQLAKSKFLNAKGLAKGHESQLRLLGLSPKNVRTGNIAQVAPIRSSIDGFIEKVDIKTGQYVQPQKPLFEIVNTEHIHADLMVFEKDISAVKNGQLVKFKVEALGNKEMTAKIYSVGKSFEDGPKALHVHAEIENKDKNLIPGMYINAQIITETNLEQALPEDAIFQEGNTYYIFAAKKENDSTWEFIPKEVIVKYKSNGFVAFDFKETIDANVLVAQRGAYYLMAEMQKSETEHTH